MICNNILEAMGNTPLIRLSNMMKTVRKFLLNLKVLTLAAQLKRELPTI